MSEMDEANSLRRVANEFAKRFANWSITLPLDDIARRRAGQIRDHGWSIRYIFGSDERGEYLEYYAIHRMTNDRRLRIYASGEVESQPAIEEAFFYRSEIPGDEDRAKQAYLEHNQAVAEELKSLGLYPEDDINTFLRTRTDEELEELERPRLKFRGEVFGWDESLLGRSDSCVAGQPRFVHGHLERRYVDALDYFQHRIDGHVVSAETVQRAVDEEMYPSWDDEEALYWPHEADRVRAYRALQSRYRDQVLRVGPGLHPIQPEGGELVGSELPDDSARLGLNFLHSEIATYAWERADELKRRKATPVLPRLERSMLASMPLCFNLFGHLRLHKWIVAHVLSEVVGIDIDKVIGIEVEVAPRPKTNYLDDNTAFDAFVEYRRQENRGLLAIETKYSEPFSAVKRDKKSLERLRSKRTYREYSTTKYGFKPGAFEAISETEANQLWRNTMLALAVKENGLDGRPPFDEAYVVVASCGVDETATRVVERVRNSHNDGENLIRHVTFEELTAACLRFAETECWAKEFRRRYLDVSVVLDSPSFDSLSLPKQLREPLPKPETPPIMSELEELFEEAGLVPPPIPHSLSPRLRRIDKWAYGTRDVEPMRMYSFEYPHEALLGNVGNYVAFCHAGHGVNSYAINYHVVFGPLAVFLQVGWGGVYMNAKEQAAKIEGWFDLCGELIYLVEQRGPVRDIAWPRLIVIQSDFRNANVVGWLEKVLIPEEADTWLAQHQRDGGLALDIAIEKLLDEDAPSSVADRRG
jgi:hypothetical protein